MPTKDTRHKAAKLTGRRSTLVSGHFLLECQCPDCEGPQFHPQGTAECIYCGKPMTVRIFTLVETENKAIPPNTSGDNAG